LAALDSREIVRTWPMRGTLHLVPSRDAKWMLALMGDRTLQGAAGRREMLGVSEELAYRAADVLSATIAEAPGPVTRQGCATALVDAGISAQGNWLYHLLWFASALGRLAGGPPQGKEQTFVSLDAWAPEHRNPSTEQALALIAAAYVRGHGPITDRELARWTGLGLGESRAGLAAALVDGTIVAVATDAGQAFATLAALEAGMASRGLGGGGIGSGEATPAPTRLLPGFDEFMLGYSEAERAIDPRHHAAVVPGSNGVFKSTVIDDGRVIALWERTLMVKTVRVTVTPLGPAGRTPTLTRAVRGRVEKAAQEYATYVGRPLDVRWATP
jgi:hypothetical protein